MEQSSTSIMVFETLDNGPLSEVIQPYAKEIRLSAKQNFTSPGDKVDCVYYIKKGRVKLFMFHDDGTVKVLYYLAAGWFFCEIPCMFGEPTGLFSQAEEAAVLYRISRKDFMKLLDENEAFRTHAFFCLSKKLLMLRYEIENITFNSCKARIKRLLCTLVDTSHLADGAWYELLVAHTHTEIGAIVGGTRVTVSRLLTELGKEGFIRIVNRRVQVSRDQYEQCRI